MRPILFHIGSLPVFAWGFMFMIAVALATYLILRRARREGFNPDHLLDLIIFVIIGGIVGARLFYVIFYEPMTYIREPLRIFMLQQGGMVFHGGLLGGVIAALLVLRKHRLPVWQVADLMAPYLALGYGIVRIGCFLNGDSYGLPTDLPVGVVFPGVDDLPRHPTQLYASAAGFLMSGILLWLRDRRVFSGQLFVQFLFLYVTYRTLVEMLRDNLRIIGPVTIAQLINAIILVIAFVLYRYLKNRSYGLKGQA
ncbi:MAG: prolipoprotein diacylglyceryl transferase [Bacillota bacterium]